MKKYKSLIIIIISLIVLLLVAIGIYLYKNNNDTTIPKDAKCVARIHYKGKDGKSNVTGDYYYYTYEFYPKGKNKYITQKSKTLNPGVTALHVEPTIIYTKIVKKYDVNDIDKEIRNDINEGTVVSYTYYDDGNIITCNSLQELFDKLF